MKTNIGPGKTRTVNYIDPTSGVRVTKEVEIPPPVKVQTLSSGATVEEIPSMEALTALWAKGIISDLVTPLTHQSRQVLADELKKNLKGQEEHQAIDALASTWQVPDDVALKVLGRLSEAVEKQKRKRGKSVERTAHMKHNAVLMQEKINRLEEENKTLHADVTKIVNERDSLKRSFGQRADFSRQDREAREARAALRQSEDDHRCTQVRLAQTEQALTQAINEGSSVRAERDALQRDAQRNLEIALAEYESAVVGKLAAVASDHNEKAKDVVRLNAEIAALKGERNVLNSLVEEQQSIAKVQKENAMSETETNEPETLRCGDKVFCKVSGEGPFVLMTQVDEAFIEYANPISGRKSSFNCGKLPITNGWLTRCKDGSYRTFPAPALTREQPKRTMSFGGVKALVTADVTSKLFQAAIWVAMLTLLYMRG